VGSLSERGQVGACAASGTTVESLLPENVAGHSKKVALLREAIERFRTASGRSSLAILDIGCGSGYAVTRFLGSADDEILGVDSYAPGIEYATRQFGTARRQFVCAEPPALARLDRRFDVIVLADVLEHLPEPGAAIDTALGLLNPRGRVLITVPNGRGPFECESALARVPKLGTGLLRATDLFVAFLNKRTPLRGAWTRALERDPADVPYNEESGHLQFFTRGALAKLLAAHGLAVLGQRNLSFLSGPFTNYLWAPSAAFCRWNTRVADALPGWLASAWFFECERSA
jgi:SAM-dependent methyltransferase